MRNGVVVVCAVVAVGLVPRLRGVQYGPASIGGVDVIAQGQDSFTGCCTAPIVSPDGHLLATSGASGINLWDLDHRLKLRFIPLRTLQLATAPVNPAFPIREYRRYGIPAFSPDGRYVASVPNAEALDLIGSSVGARLPDVWSVASGEPVGASMWTQNADGTVTNDTLPWTAAEIASWRTLRTVQGTKLAAAYRGPGSLFTREGARAVEVRHGAWPNGTSAVSIFDTRNSERLLSASIAKGVYRFVASADGRWFATTSSDGHLRVFDAASGRLQTLKVKEPDGRITVRELGADGMAFSHDGEWFAIPTQSGISLFASKDMVRVRELAAGQDQWHSTSGLTFSPDDRRLVSDYPLAVWDLETGALTFTLSSATRPSTALAFSPEGARLAVATTDEAVPDAGGYGNSDGKVVLWSLADGTAPRVVASHENTIRGLAFTPDGGHIIAGSADASVSARSSGQEGAVRLWDVASGEVAVALASFDAESSSTGVAVSPDGRLLAAVVLPFAPSKPSHSGISAFTNASYRAVLRLWDAATGKPLREIHVGSDTAVGLAMSGDGARIAVLSGRDVLVWSTRTGRPVNRIPIEAPTANVNLQAHGNEELTAAAWLPDNRRLVVSGGRGVLGIWDVLTSIAVNRFDGVSADVKAIAVDPTGRYIAAGDCDGLLRVWAAPRWHLAFTRAAHQGCVTAVAFGPSGQLASSGEDGVTRLWDETGNWRAAIATVRNTDDWLVIGPDGRYDGTATGERTAIAFRQSTSAWSPEQFAGRCGPPICCPAERATPATALPPCLGL